MNAIYSAEFKRRSATHHAPRWIPHAQAWGYGRSPLTRRNPGDLVLDPTCGSGTTSYVAEQWGRRWITIDTSRVLLALARQRLLTATLPYCEIHSGSAPVVAQISQSAVSPTSKSAGRANDKAGLETRDTADLEVCATGLAAFVFGPENGAVSEQLVFQAAKEAYAKSYRHLYVIGFAIQDAATKLIQNCEAVVGIPATYVAATMDLQMHDLLKTTRASQIFSVTGAPEIRLVKLPKKSRDGDELYQVELLGLDVFDPVTMETTHRKGDDVPAWFWDTDYNELAFCVAQAFFPRTAAWDNLKRAFARRVCRQRVGASGRHGERAVRRRRTQADCREGH